MKKAMLWGLAFSILLSSAALALEVGDRAPLFQGQSTRGTVGSEDYLGEKFVVLAFYFADSIPA